MRLPAVSRPKRSPSRAAICATDSARPGRRQLDRQRDAVEPARNLGRPPAVRRGERETRRDRGGAGDEQLHRLEPRELVGRERPLGPRPGAAAGPDGVRRRQRQGRDRPGVLGLDPQRLAAGGEHGEPRTRAQQRIDQLGTGRTRCSQLSSSSSSCFGAGSRPACRAAAAPAPPARRAAVATACGTRAGSASDASSTSQTPSANAPASPSAAASASRVLPMPGGPVSVSSRGPAGAVPEPGTQPRRLAGAGTAGRPSARAPGPPAASAAAGGPGAVAARTFASAARRVGRVTNATARHAGCAGDWPGHHYLTTPPAIGQQWMAADPAGAPTLAAWLRWASLLAWGTTAALLTACAGARGAAGTAAPLYVANAGDGTVPPARQPHGTAAGPGGARPPGAGAARRRPRRRAAGAAAPRARTAARSPVSRPPLSPAGARNAGGRGPSPWASRRRT